MSYHYLICEGEPDGLDVRLLDKVVAQYYGKDVEIVPARGDSGLKSVAEHYRVQLAQPEKQPGYVSSSRQVFSVQDRNFRSPEEVQGSWKPGSKHFIWHRHEIENYLLDPRIIARLFDKLQRVRSARSNRMPNGMEESSHFMRQLAEPMLEEHVGWLTYHYLVPRIWGQVDLRFKGPPKNRNQTWPRNDRQSWLIHLNDELRRLRNGCVALANSHNFSDDLIPDIYDGMLEQRKADGFWTKGQFLTEMGGHELMSHLLEEMNKWWPKLNLGTLQSELLRALDDLYAPYFFYPIDDFYELAQRIE
ncbi:MAG: hypothetical protein HQK57_06525 [Deltaproteobacteria bacterium]|nr:hypothetical protein [Deltaproteobacteria bacterium]